MRADFRVTNWLNAPSPLQVPLGNSGMVPAFCGMTNLHVLARLIAKNGFVANPQSWGRFQGPFGLTFPEYRLLLELSVYLQGLIDGAGLNSIATLQTYLEPELMRLAAEFEATEPPPAAEVEAVAGQDEVAAE